MAKYMVRCETCGKDFLAYLDGKVKDREWKLENWTWICEECKESEFQRKNQEAAAENAKEGLPALKGSEKQIAWAESIRAEAQPILDEIKDRCRELIASAKEKGDKDEQEKHEEALRAAEYVTNNPFAKYWIESRFSINKWFFAEEMERVLPMVQERESKAKEDELSAIVEAKAEATVRPEDTKTETVAEIKVVDGDVIAISFPERREDFRRLVKHDLGCCWKDKAWRKRITQFSGPIEERVVEAGSKLLLAGFPVRIYDEGLRSRAISGDYRPEKKNWIVRDSESGNFVIRWGYGEDYYWRAVKLRGAKYDSRLKRIVLSPEFYEEVIDFAEAHGFEFSAKALELVEIGKAVREKTLVCAPKEPEPIPESEPTPEPEEYGIDESLRDDN